MSSDVLRAISTTGLLFVLFLTSLLALTAGAPEAAQTSPMVINGGPGQALRFFGKQSAALFKLEEVSGTIRDFTLEFWVAPACSSYSCAFFTMNSFNFSDFAYMHHQSLYCFGQQFVLSDGALPGLDAPPRWHLFSEAQSRRIWHHFAFVVHNDATPSCAIYINNNLFVNATLPQTTNSNSTASMFGGPGSRLILGQLVLRDQPIFPINSFQGTVDEIRLWRTRRFPGEGSNTWRRSVLASEKDSSLISLWSMDTESYISLTNSFSNITDTMGNNTGHRVSVEWLQSGNSNPEEESVVSAFPHITLGPSTAPVVTYNGILLFHVNTTSFTTFSMRYLCIWPGGYTDFCPPLNGTETKKRITVFPTFGKVYAVDSNTGQSTALVSTMTLTSLDSLAYEPIEFLLVQNNYLDSFMWSVAGSPSCFVQIYAPPATAYPAWMPPEIPPVKVYNSIETAFDLPCGSLLGDDAIAVLTSVPASGQLYQVVMQANGSIWHYEPTWQISTCSTTAINASCTVSHLSGTLIYQPDIADSSDYMNLNLTYVCISPNMVGVSGPQTVKFEWSKISSVVHFPYDASMVGPNPHAVQFDGRWTQLSAYINRSLPIQAIGLWVYPKNEIVRSSDDITYLTTITNDRRTLLHIFPEQSYLFPFEIVLCRNSTSYPNYFITVTNYNRSPAAGTMGTMTISSFSSGVWLVPDTWSNVLFTILPGSTTTAVIYISGSPVASGPIGYLAPPAQLHLGYSPLHLGDSHFSGILDEFSIWSAPFGAFDALSMQYVRVRSTDKNLAAFWDFNIARSGKQEVDLITGLILETKTSNPACIPQKVYPAGLPFDYIETSAVSPQLITLASHPGDGRAVWQMGTYLINLPSNGVLYQLPANFSVDVVLTPEFLSTLEPISAPYSASTLSSVPVVTQWASQVLASSSSRTPPIGTDYWQATHIAGPPFWWAPLSSSSISSRSPVYADSPLSWCPASACSGGIGNLEWVEVAYETAVYLRNVEVFQNFNPGAVTRIYAWDDPVQQWRLIYNADPIPQGSEYSTLAPRFCSIVAFKTQKIRVELDPCKYHGRHQIEAIRISGTTKLPPGIVSNPEGRIVYVPDSVTPGADTITYTASSCPFFLPSNSPHFSYHLRIAAVSTIPRSYAERINVQAREETKILLGGYSPDPTVSSFQRIISKVPAAGTLHQAVRNSEGELVAGPLIPSGSRTLVANSEGYVFYRAPSACQYNFTSFSYYVSAQGKPSEPSTVTLNTLCSPSYLNYRRWLLVMLLVIILAGLGLAIGCTALTILKRNDRKIVEDRAEVLLITCIGSVICFASLLFVLSPITRAWCLAHLWTLHLGTSVVVSGAFALILSKWNDFTSKTLKCSRESSDLPRSTVALVVAVILIEMTQLIVWSTVNPPYPHSFASPDNPAIMMATCDPKKFSNNFLLINKAFWLSAVLILSCIFYSVSSIIIRTSIITLLSSIIGLVCGIAFTAAIGYTKSPDVSLVLHVLAVTLPISIFLVTLFSDKIMKSPASSKQTIVETSEFGLQPISPQQSIIRHKSSSSSLSESVANAQMTMSMNNHSVDKSIANLLDTVQDKEREISALKRKLLKQHYRIRDLQQRLTDTIEGSNMMYGTTQDE